MAKVLEQSGSKIEIRANFSLAPPLHHKYVQPQFNWATVSKKVLNLK